mmetsp:Transcript_25465/g.84835  ORF Transcript_25465/g.84835 Transcript_25465/m.84835 type:complete len:345 (-) Transcript_25465:327-1361(-)
MGGCADGAAGAPGVLRAARLVRLLALPGHQLHRALGAGARVRTRRLHGLAAGERHRRLAPPLLPPHALLLVGDHARQAPPLHEPHDERRDVGPVHRQPRQGLGQVRKVSRRDVAPHRRRRAAGLVHVPLHQRDGRQAKRGPVALLSECARALQAEGRQPRPRLQPRHAADGRCARLVRERVGSLCGLLQLPRAADRLQLLPVRHHLHAAHTRGRPPLRRGEVDLAARRALHHRPLDGPARRLEAAPHRRLTRGAPHLLRDALLRRQGGHPVRAQAPRRLLQVALRHGRRRLRVSRLLEGLLRVHAQGRRRRAWRGRLPLVPLSPARPPLCGGGGGGGAEDGAAR